MLHRIIATKPAMPSTEVPKSWAFVGSTAAGATFMHRKSRLAVILSIDALDDGSVWLHASCSRRDRLPSWDDLRAVKNTFIGPEVEAFQCLPRESEYVNLMPHCLHLWARMEV